jgi:hypothetical protein
MGPVGPALALGCRIVLAVVLAVAAVAKVANRRELPGQLRAMGVAAGGLSVAVAVALPLVELAVAVALIAIPHSSGPAFVAVAVLAMFTGVLVVTARRSVPCPCFGAVRREQAGVGGAVMRNGLLVALAVIATGSVTGARAGATVLVVAIGAAAAALAVTRVA